MDTAKKHAAFLAVKASDADPVNAPDPQVHAPKDTAATIRRAAPVVQPPAIRIVKPVNCPDGAIAVEEKDMLRAARMDAEITETIVKSCLADFHMPGFPVYYLKPTDPEPEAIKPDTTIATKPVKASK
ncbi:MAG: hypothetical protein WC869_08260 [Phycisphaerae bacterium]|jgi:hypothetical protein